MATLEDAVRGCIYALANRETFADSETLDALGFDELDRFELALNLENATGVDLNDDDVQAFVTVADVIETVKKASQ